MKRESFANQNLPDFEFRYQRILEAIPELPDDTDEEQKRFVALLKQKYERIIAPDRVEEYTADQPADYLALSLYIPDEEESRVYLERALKLYEEAGGEIQWEEEASS